MFCYNHTIVKRDLEEICNLPCLAELNNKSVLVTGANGMIATYVVYALMHMVDCQKLNIKIIALARNKDKAAELFGDFAGSPHFELLIQDVCDPIACNAPVDFIFHFAGNASPYYITHDPVGIMKSNLLGTLNVLEFAQKSNTRKVIFASTREVYGENKTEQSLSETSFGSIDCMDGRSCYPESKRAAETLCKSYYLQYGVNFNAVRIAHTYGPGMKLDNDGRVMADLLSCVIHNRNIILKSKGDALRAFCYITDTVRGLFQILLQGGDAEAYNLANETEEISIRDLAEMLTRVCPEKRLEVEYHIPEGQQTAYCNYKRVGLDTTKIEAIGWKPATPLKEGIIRTIKSFEE